MTTHEAAMRQALEALEYHQAQTRPIERTQQAIEALRSALAQQGEPVWSNGDEPLIGGGLIRLGKVDSQIREVLETTQAPAPQAQQPQSLTVVSSYTADIDAIRRKEKEDGEALQKPLRIKKIDKLKWVKDLKDGAVMGNHSEPEDESVLVPQAQQPLTIEEVEQIIQQHNYELHGDRARYIVRMTEQAHGIGEKPNIQTQILKDISARDCSTCKNFNGGNYDADCYECSQYFVTRWEAKE